MIRHLFILISLMCALCAAAESHYKPHISVGAHAGMDMSRVSFSPSIEQKWQQGLTGGLQIRYAEERLVGLLAEINFTQRGWKENFEGTSLEYSRTANYISLPIMTHIYFGPSRCKFFFNLGPEFSYMISETTSTNFDVTNIGALPEWPEDPRMIEQLTTPIKNKFDYGICASFGVEFWVKPRHSVYLEGRYYFGLGNIFPSSKADTFGASRNMSISATLGYNFRLR